MSPFNTHDSKKWTQAALASSLIFLSPIAWSLNITDSKSQTYQTSDADGMGTADDITITSTGQIAVTGNLKAVIGDSANKTITIEPNNTNNDKNAISTVNGNAIDIQSQNNTVNIGQNSSVTSSGTGIGIHANKGTGFNLDINQSGTIKTTNASALKIEETGARIINSSTGTLQSTDENATTVDLLADFNSFTNQSGGKIISAGANGNGIAVNIKNATGTFTNSGLIDGNESKAIRFDNADGTFTNTQSGTLTSQADTVLVEGASTAKITNAGRIETLGTIAGNDDGAIHLKADLTGGLSNSGTIVATSGGANSTSAILINNNAVTTSITNSGTLQGDNGAYGIKIDSAFTGDIKNTTGTITTDFQTALYLGDVALTGGIINSGTINITDGASPNSAVVAAGANSEITNGFNNKGTLSVAKTDGVALDFSLSGKSINFTNSGTVTGDVKLSGGGGNIFTMTAGTLDGQLFAKDGAANILTVTGGTLNKAIQLGNKGDTFNLGGATVNGTITGGGGADTLNITSSVTTTETVTNIKTIEVKNPNTRYLVNGNITGLDTLLKTNVNTIFETDAKIKGAGRVDNAGTLIINPGRIFALTGAFDNKGSLTNRGEMSQTVEVKAGQGAIINSGTIDGQANSAIKVTGNYTGDITNEVGGKITSTGASATIDLGAAVTGKLINAGTLETTDKTKGGPVIKASNVAAKVTQGIINTGTIVNANSGASAIDLGTSNQPILLTNSGVIRGNVVLSNGGGDVFKMTGGVLDGTLNSSNSNSTLTLTGGTINGAITLTNSDDTVNVGSININGILDGNGGNDTLNVVGDFMSLKDINNFQTINFNKQVEFDVGAPITGLNTKLNINLGATLDVNGPITGTGVVTNKGNVIVNQNQTVTLGNFTNNDASGQGQVGIAAGGKLTVTDYTQNVQGNALGFEIASKNLFGQLITNNGFVLDNSKVAIALAGTEVIENGDSFILIDNNGAAPSINNIEFIQPQSSTLAFDFKINNNNFVVTATRTPLSNLTLNPATEDLASLLDELFPGNDQLKSAYIALDTLTLSQLNEALTSLLPTQGLQLQQGLADVLSRHTQATLSHLESHTRPMNNQWTRPTESLRGISSGDGSDEHNGVWSYVFFNKERQKNKNFAYGYDGDGFGLGVGWDHEFFNETWLGLSFGFSQNDFDSLSPTKNKLKQKSYMLSMYGEHRLYGTPMYIDALASVTYNTYKNSRFVTFGATSGGNYASFNAYYYDAYARFNYDWQWRAYTLTPFVSLEYAHYSPEDYTETGLVPLVVHYDSTELLEPGLGLKIRWQNEYRDALYTPEIYASVKYDMLNENIVSKNHFAGIATRPFASQGTKPAQLSYQLGFNVNVYNKNSWYLIFGYDFEGRQGYKDYSSHMKLRFEWY